MTNAIHVSVIVGTILVLAGESEAHGRDDCQRCTPAYHSFPRDVYYQEFRNYDYGNSSSKDYYIGNLHRRISRTASRPRK